MKILDLPPELLQIVALRVLRNGELYWFSTTSSACANAARTVCQQQKMPMASHLRNAFLSLKRLLRTASVMEVHGIVHAQMNAWGGTASRPHSLDGQFTWSPAGEKAIAASAPIEVLDYAWANWVVSTNIVNPGCFLMRACAAGRVDLLKHMDQRADALRVQSGVQKQTLFHIMNAALIGCESALSTVEKAIVVPAIESSNFEAIKWYHHRQEVAEFSADIFTCDQPKWRRQFAAGLGLDRLTVAAVSSRDPKYTLDQLRFWLWPRLGERAPRMQNDANMQIANVVLVAAAEAINVPVGAWEWLEAYESLGITYLFAALRGPPTNLRAVKIYRSLMLPRSAVRYRWMVERVGERQWLGDVFERYGDHEPRISGLYREGGASRRLSFAISIVQDVVGRATPSDTNSADEAWVTDEALCLEALSDALVWSWERPMPEGDPGEVECNDVGRKWMEKFKVDTFDALVWLMKTHMDTAMDVLKRFYQRADFEMTRGREYTKRGLKELCTPRLGQFLRQRLTLDAEFAKVWG